MHCCAVLVLIGIIFISGTFGRDTRLVTRLDEYRNVFLLLRQQTVKNTFQQIDNIFEGNIKQGKIQWRIPDSQPFPCDPKNARSLVTPISVNKLRPGDIDVIACIGDSLSAANGAISTNLEHVVVEFRSIAFPGGGRASWRKYLTLPNILKAFNPNLYGYATSDGPTVNSQSRLNIAEPMLWTTDLTFQVKTLIDRMRNDPNVNMENHWKMLTIFVGNNDICTDMCHHDSLEEFVISVENNFLKSLRLLRDNVPRLFVNILPVMNPSLFSNLKGIPNQCEVIYKLGCHCLFKAMMQKDEMNKYIKAIKEIVRRQEQITDLVEFQTQDFAVVFQPFFTNLTIPLDRNGNIDFRPMASDCFHFSQLGHAWAANALWNNLMQPEGLKQLRVYPLFERFECPTVQKPFIATKANSRAISPSLH